MDISWTMSEDLDHNQEKSNSRLHLASSKEVSSLLKFETQKFTRDVLYVLQTSKGHFGDQAGALEVQSGNGYGRISG